MIHPTAEVSSEAEIGKGTKVWHQVQIREGVRVGRDCILGKGAYLDRGVKIGDRVKIQNYASIFHGAVVQDGVFIGPYACLTNDRMPRAITPAGELKGDADWIEAGVLVKEGASVGAGAVVLPGVVIGRFAMVGAGAVVTRSVPDHGLVAGNPARPLGYVCRCGERLVRRDSELTCSRCGETYRGLEGAE